MNGAAGPDPVAVAVIEALARRAAAQQGEARALMLQRVDALRAAQAAAPAAAAGAAPVARAQALAALSALVDRLGRSPAVAQSPQSLKSVTAFKATWSRLRAEQRLRQALAQVPAMAGPLNSQQVVNRALQAMHGLSPQYLDAFMAHVDTLLALEQASPLPISPGSARAAARSPR